MPSSPKVWTGNGTHGAGPLRVILHINSFANNHKNGHLTHLSITLTGFIDMLSSCGYALSLEFGSDFDRTELRGNSPWLQWLRESLEMVGSTAWGHTCLDILWQPRRSGKIGNAGRCCWLWEELEIGMQRKINTWI